MKHIILDNSFNTCGLVCYMREFSRSYDLKLVNFILTVLVNINGKHLLIRSRF